MGYFIQYRGGTRRATKRILLPVIVLCLVFFAHTVCAQYHPASLWSVEYWFETDNGTSPGYLNATLRWPLWYSEDYYNPPLEYRDCWHRVHIDGYNSPQGREYHSGGRAQASDRFESTVGLRQALIESTDHPVYYDASHGSISALGVSVIKLVWQGAGDPPPQITVYVRAKVTAVASGYPDSGYPPRGIVFSIARAFVDNFLEQADASAPSDKTHDMHSSEFIVAGTIPVQLEQRTGRYVAVVNLPVQLIAQVWMDPSGVHYNSPSEPRTHGTRMGYAAASFMRLVDVYQATNVVLLDMGVSLTDAAGWFCDPALCRLRPATGQTAYTIPFALTDVPHTGYTRTSAPKERDDYMGLPLVPSDSWFGLERICVVVRSTGQDDSSTLAEPGREAPVPLVPVWGRVGDGDLTGNLRPRIREVVVYDATGISLRFWKVAEQNGAPVYVGAKGVYSQLEEPVAGSFILRGGPPGAMHTKGNWFYQFSALPDQPRTAYIASIVDPLGNNLSFTRDATGAVMMTDSLSGSKLRFYSGGVYHQLGNSSSWTYLGSVCSTSISWGNVYFSANGMSSLTIPASGGGYGGGYYGNFWQESWTWTNASMNNQTAPENGMRLGSYRIGSLYPTSYQYEYLERSNGQPRKLRITIQPQGKPASTLTYFFATEPTPPFDETGMFSRIEYVRPSLSHAGNEKTVYLLDRDGRVTSVAYYRYESDAQPAWTESYSYLPGDADKVTQYTDRAGNLWQFGYTQIGQANLLNSVTDPSGVQTTITYNSGELPTAVRDGAGNEWRFEYLPDGRLLSFAEPERLPWVVDYYPTNHQWRNKPSALYDPTGRVLRITQYDGLGRANRWEAYPNGEGQPSIWHEVTLNPFGLPIQIRYSDNTSISLIWNNIVPVEIQDARGRTVNFTYNYFNEPNSPLVGAAGLLTSIRFGNYSYPFAKLDYDLYGRLVRVQGGGGTGVSYTYGTRDELRTVQADGLNPESFDYTCCGRVKQWTKPDGTQVQFTYRPTGEVTQITVNGTPYSTYTYDAAGRLLTASNEAGSIQFTYDAHTGRLMQEAGATGTVYALGYQYLPSGEVSTLTTLWGTTLQYQYDQAGRLTDIRYNGVPLVRYTYDGAGRLLTQQVYPLGTNSTLLTNIQYADSQSVGAVGLIQHSFNGNLLAQYDYRGTGANDRGYYPDGTLRKAMEQVSGAPYRVWLWEYYGDGSLQYEQLNNSTTNFSYDPNGNLTAWGSATGWQYTQNRLTAVTSRNWSFTYDANGNRQTARWQGGLGLDDLYTYDAFDNLIQVSVSSLYNARYDALGRRVCYATAQEELAFIYDGDVLLAEADDNGVRAVYIWGLLGPVARVDLRSAGGTRYYLLDARGHTRLLLDSQGNITDRYTYDAWGNPIEQVGSTFNPFRWNGAYGYEWTPATGLYHVGAREYDPRTGRWLQKDPIGTAAGDPNLYRYADNEPINRADTGGAKTCIKTILFTGNKLKFFDETGKLVQTVTAWSGMPGATPNDQHKRHFGPIPEGIYWIDPKDVQQSTWAFWRWREKGYYPPSSSWGRYRVPLKPDPSTNTCNRGGFFLHGSTSPGSAGCIDLVSNDYLIGSLIKRRGCEKIKVVVAYPNRSISVPKPQPPSPPFTGPPDRRYLP